MYRKERFILVLLLAVACADGDADSTDMSNDAGVSTSDVLALPGEDTETNGTDAGLSSCKPTKTCVGDYSGQCGDQLDDGCGGFIDCRNACQTVGKVCQDGKCVDKSSICTPSCGSNQCGDDGCGGSCGVCDAGFSCVNGMCKNDCKANCTDKVCGDDGCGGSCGECSDGDTCDAGICNSCTADCTDKSCGSDGCGGTCGECKDAETCKDGACQSDCTADCTDKQCGSDGCGGTCGDCTDEQVCTDGQCIKKIIGAILINEVQPDPGTLDSNCDGEAKSKEDEFVEIVNVGNVSFTLDGYTLEDSKNVVHVFPKGSIVPPGGVMVVFGGGKPTFDGTGLVNGAWCQQIGQMVSMQTASSGGLNLNNDGDTLVFKSIAGNVQQSISYDSADLEDNNSLNLSPDKGAQDSWTKHSTVSGDKALPHSPGTAADGTAY